MEGVARGAGLREALQLLVKGLGGVREDHLVVVLVHHRLRWWVWVWVWGLCGIGIDVSTLNGCRRGTEAVRTL